MAYKLGVVTSFYTNFIPRALAAANSTEPEASKIKWYIFREDCFEQIVNKFDLSNTDCLKFALSKAIGYAIIAGSAILKVPQISKILSNQSVVGISKFLFYLEVRVIN